MPQVKIARPLRNRMHGAALCACSILPVGMTLWPIPAAAQMTVYDPSNYAQNLLTAARSLQQITNQIHSLQNEATILMNQAKNLSRIDFPEMQALTRTLQQIDQLMGQGRGLSFRVGSFDSEYRQLFPQGVAPTSTGAGVASAQARLNASIAAFNQSLKIQSQVAGNVASDADLLGSITAKSQNAEGALQATQASNQLIALAAKQQFQIQAMMAAQYRAETLEAARRAQAESDARAQTLKFLGSGTAYHSP